MGKKKSGSKKKGGSSKKQAAKKKERELAANNPTPEATAQALTFKAQGNDAFKTGDYATAVRAEM
mgnify:CR=1 FL=1